MSTRDFLLDRSRLPTLRPERPGPRAALAALAKGAIWKRRAWRAPAEAALSRAMTRAGLSRVDFLGAAPGMWSLHPPQRSREFYDATTDPYQLTSLHDSTNADRVSQRQVMSQWLGGFRDCGGGTCQTLEFWVAR